MSRLSIELTSEQHQQIKAIAALQGRSIRDYVLERILPAGGNETAALQELEDLLAARIKEVENGNAHEATARDIFQKTFADE